MRVIHILDHSLPVRSAYSLRTVAILREQRAIGWETFHLTGPRQGPSTLTEEQVEGWHFYRTPPPGGVLEGVPVLGEFEWMGEIAYRVERLARNVRPHVLHAHSPVLNAVAALRVGRRLGIPVVYELRAPAEEEAEGIAPRSGLRRILARRLETWVLKRADAVTTVSEALRSQMLARGVLAEKVTVIPGAAPGENGSAVDGIPTWSGRNWKASVARYQEVYARIQQPALRT